MTSVRPSGQYQVAANVYTDKLGNSQKLVDYYESTQLDVYAAQALTNRFDNPTYYGS